MLDGIKNAKTFGDIYDTIKAAHEVLPIEVPRAEQQLARIVGGIFTMELAGEFAAPTAGRLMYEVATGVVRMALDEDVEDYRPLRWEKIKPADRTPVYVAALLATLRPHLGEEEWSTKAGKLFSTWANTQKFPSKLVKTLETKYKELYDERSG